MEPENYTQPIKLRKDGRTGYWYFIDHEHPLADSHGRVQYARHVVSVGEKRWIAKNELVVYADRNRDNLDPGNLKIRVQAEASRKDVLPAPPLVCPRCGQVFHERPSHVHLRHYHDKVCKSRALRKFDPPAEELHRLVWQMPAVEVAKKFGVSDKAVEKRCKRLGIDKPPRGYWAQVEAGKIEPRTFPDPQGSQN